MVAPADDRRMYANDAPEGFEPIDVCEFTAVLPASRWHAFKLRWLPKWVLRWWPARTTTIRTTGRIVGYSIDKKTGDMAARVEIKTDEVQG